MLAAVPGDGPVLYARVDTVTADDGQPLLLELELTEPFLFLETEPAAAATFAAAVREWLRTQPAPRPNRRPGWARES